MYAQLGNIIFEAVNSPESFSRNDETTYAQFDLVNVKPRLQPVGNNLEELSIGLKFRAEFTNPTQSILTLKNSKDNFEVLSLLMGNGRYVGDYVIVAMTEQHNVAFMDGSLIEASVTLSLKEYVVPDKLQQQQIAARKQGFAVGDKKPIRVVASEKFTPPQSASLDLSAINSQASVVNQKTSDWEHNVSQRQDISNQIQSSLKKSSDSLNSFQEKVQALKDQTGVDSIVNSINAVKGNISNFQLPVTDLATLQNNNLNYQSSINGLKTASTPLTNPIILRQI